LSSSTSFANPFVFKNRSLEVFLLGGIASLKFGRPGGPTAIENAASATHDPRYLLEDPETLQVRALTSLADMRKKFDEANRGAVVLTNGLKSDTFRAFIGSIYPRF
jgi:hypothetical protein